MSKSVSIYQVRWISAVQDHRKSDRASVTEQADVVQHRVGTKVFLQEYFEGTPWSVWPDGELKSSPNFSKSCPNNPHSNFYENSLFFNIA